jgi:hypothetical protein
MVEAMKVTSSHDNESYIASKKFFAKRQSIKDLGNAVKFLGLTKINDNGESQGIRFINASEKMNAHVAQSDSYTLIMHFGEIISKAI